MKEVWELEAQGLEVESVRCTGQDKFEHKSDTQKLDRAGTSPDIWSEIRLGNLMVRALA